MNPADFKKHVWLTAFSASFAIVSPLCAQDLFDDSFLGEAAPVIPVAQSGQKKLPPTSAPVPAKVGTQQESAFVAPTPPPPPPPPPSLAPDLSFDMGEPSLSLDMVKPPSASVATPPKGRNVPPPKNLSLSTPPSEQFLGKLSSDVFREMADMERENNTLMLQLKREQLRSEIDALKTSNRQMLFDEIERREKMTQARLEWELAQELKRQEALERKQKSEIRQKQIEAALKREEDRRIQRTKEEEEERLKKEEEAKVATEKKEAEIKAKYDAASLISLNELKPTLMAIMRPTKPKRVPKTVAEDLTQMGEDLITRKKAGQALTIADIATTATTGTEKEKEEPTATSLYTMTEIRGTAGVLIAKLISKAEKMTIYAKKGTILPTGHTVIDVDKDYILVQKGKRKEMVGFASAGLLSDGGSSNVTEDQGGNDGGSSSGFGRGRRTRSTVDTGRQAPAVTSPSVGGAMAR